MSSRKCPAPDLFVKVEVRLIVIGGINETAPQVLE